MGINRRLPADNPVSRRAHELGQCVEPGASVVRVVPSSQRLFGRKMALLESIIDRLHVRVSNRDDVDIDTVKMSRMAQQMLCDLRRDERESEQKAPSEMTEEEIVAQLSEMGIEVRL